MTLSILKKKLLDEVEDYIRKNLKNPKFCVYMILAEFGISYSYFWEIISLHFLMNPAQLIETLRLEKVIKIIPNNSNTLLHIGKEVGYNNPKSFRNAFKKRLKMTPNDYKQKLRDCEDIEKEIESMKALLWNTTGEKFR